MSWLLAMQLIIRGACGVGTRRPPDKSDGAPPACGDVLEFSLRTAQPCLGGPAAAVFRFAQNLYLRVLFKVQ